MQREQAKAVRRADAENAALAPAVLHCTTLKALSSCLPKLAASLSGCDALASARADGEVRGSGVHVRVYT